MSLLLTRVRAEPVRVPRVNLLPPEVGEAERLRRLQAALAGAAVVAALLLTLLYLAAVRSVDEAAAEQERSEATARALAQEVDALAGVPAVYAGVARAEAQLTLAMGREVRWSRYLNNLAVSTPDTVWLTNLVAAQTDAAAGAAPAPAPGAFPQPLSLGTITYSGKGLTHDDVAAFVAALEKLEGADNPYFTNSTVELIDQRKAVSFVASSLLSPGALSHRYDGTGVAR